ncbi:hypothetical protein FD754_000810 [Muntiacus muntjak]|uniref:Acyl-CoA-binding protein n=1 Tax=Muntiacus muntjak TaxID=9888 RepID=A0A5N3W575_MUNMU|nr:hypothetical protein FD754_000810 [Muntiacus muntjak]
MSQAEFDKAAEEAKQLKAKPADEEMLFLYSRYKQATVGDVNTDCPLPCFHISVGRLAWDSYHFLIMDCGARLKKIKYGF